MDHIPSSKDSSRGTPTCRTQNRPLLQGQAADPAVWVAVPAAWRLPLLAPSLEPRRGGTFVQIKSAEPISGALESSIKADEAQRNHVALPEGNDSISDVFHFIRFPLDGLGDAAAGA